MVTTSYLSPDPPEEINNTLRWDIKNNGPFFIILGILFLVMILYIFFTGPIADKVEKIDVKKQTEIFNKEIIAIKDQITLINEGIKKLNKKSDEIKSNLKSHIDDEAIKESIKDLEDKLTKCCEIWEQNKP
ncbi:MAG: hypothetical protein KF908_15255 [Nitrosomonas sp.]|nr:hypothetical protein [Nitrosomonas sp.]MCW5609004.1 hypothetical protein [Nitrosomonas sp.]